MTSPTQPRPAILPPPLGWAGRVEPKRDAVTIAAATPWGRAHASASATPTCADCHVMRPLANLTRLETGELWCPESLSRQAEAQITHPAPRQPEVELAW